MYCLAELLSAEKIVTSCNANKDSIKNGAKAVSLLVMKVI